VGGCGGGGGRGKVGLGGRKGGVGKGGGGKKGGESINLLVFSCFFLGGGGGEGGPHLIKGAFCFVTALNVHCNV